MPPRHAYWTILVGESPTAFRAADRADLLPTFERLKQKHPEVVLKWFARGRLWESPEAQRASEHAPAPPVDRERRGPEWRPGGTHRDPRDRFKPKKREPRDRGAGPGGPRPNSRGAEFSRKPADGPPRDRPFDKAQGRPPKPAWRPKPGFSARPPGGRPPQGKPFGSRPFDKAQGRPPQGRSFSKPPYDKRRGGSPKPGWQPKPGFSARPPGGRPPEGKPFGKPFDKPQGRPPQGRSFSKPPYDRSKGRSFSKPPYDKPQGRSFDKPQGRPPGKPFGRPPQGRPLDKAQGRPFDRPRGDRPPSSPPPEPRPKDEERVEASRKGGTRLLKKPKR